MDKIKDTDDKEEDKEGTKTIYIGQSRGYRERRYMYRTK